MGRSYHTHFGISLALALVFSSVVLTALAQEQATGTERQAERRAALEVRLQERIVNLVSNTSLRLTSAIDRFGDIVSRLDTRVAKLKAAGVDTQAGEAKLSAAKHRLVEVSITIENIGPVWSTLSGDKPREAFQSIKTDLLSARDGLKDVHTLLGECVALLKEAVREAELGRGVSGAVTEGQEPAINE